MAREKVPSKAASLGTLIGAPAGIVICWLAELAGFPPPLAVAGAIGALCVGILTYAFPGGRVGEGD